MRSRHVLLASSLFAGVLVAGCAFSDRPTSPSPTGPGSGSQSPGSAVCRPEPAQFSVGQRATDDLLERARVAAGASVARYIRPDDVITMEYLESRLNLHLDRQDVVARLTCG